MIIDTSKLEYVLVTNRYSARQPRLTKDKIYHSQQNAHLHVNNSLESRFGRKTAIPRVIKTYICSFAIYKDQTYNYYKIAGRFF
jgi:hypothetical protein